MVHLIVLRPFQQLRQTGDAGRDLPRLIFGHEIRCGTSARLRLEIDVRDCKVVSITDLMFSQCPSVAA